MHPVLKVLIWVAVCLLIVYTAFRLTIDIYLATQCHLILGTEVCK